MASHVKEIETKAKEGQQISQIDTVKQDFIQLLEFFT